MVRRVLQGGLRLWRRLVDFLRRLLGGRGPSVERGFQEGAWKRRRRVLQRLWQVARRPQNPNNLFLDDGAAYASADEAARRVHLDLPQGDQAPVLSHAVQAVQRFWAPGRPVPLLNTWRAPDQRRIALESERVNLALGYGEILDREIKKIREDDLDDLGRAIDRLAKRWRIRDQTYENSRRRMRLDVRRTLRVNLPRYGGRVLELFRLTRERPVPKASRPSRLLLIGDVSRSMAQYVSVCLYFFHQLGFRFQVQSWVFSEKPTWATPYMESPGSFRDRVGRLAVGAESWYKGTRLGSSLQAILAKARVDRDTYVIILTDGKVAIHHGEMELLLRHTEALSQAGRRLYIITPQNDLKELGGPFAKTLERAVQAPQPELSFTPIPIRDIRTVWYGAVARHVDHIFHARTVRELAAVVDVLAAERTG